MKEINAHTHFNVTYDKIKKGRSIDSIVFHIEKKRMADDNSYKLDDRAYQEDKARKAETEDELVLQAINSLILSYLWNISYCLILTLWT